MTRARRAVVALGAAAALLPLGAGTASAQSFLDAADPCTVPAPTAPFTDRAGVEPVHALNVDCAAAQGITLGTASGTYDPLGPVGRDQMAAFIVRTLEAGGYDLPAPTVPAGQGFTDIAGNTFEDDIKVLKAIGVTIGTADPTRYDPDGVVRRDQMASYLVRAANYAYDGDDLAAGTVGPFPFTDVPAGNEHRVSIAAANELIGIAQGTTPTAYNPGQNTRRDQMATFLVRLLDVTALPESTQ